MKRWPANANLLSRPSSSGCRLARRAAASSVEGKRVCRAKNAICWCGCGAGAKDGSCFEGLGPVDQTRRLSRATARPAMRSASERAAGKARRTRGCVSTTLATILSRRGRNVADLGNGVPHRRHQPIGGAAQVEADPVGERRAARGAVGPQMAFVQPRQPLGDAETALRRGQQLFATVRGETTAVQGGRDVRPLHGCKPKAWIVSWTMAVAAGRGSGLAPAPNSYAASMLSAMLATAASPCR